MLFEEDFLYSRSILLVGGFNILSLLMFEFSTLVGILANLSISRSSRFIQPLPVMIIKIGVKQPHIWIVGHSGTFTSY